MQSHANDPGPPAEGGSARSGGGPSVSPHNMPEGDSSKPSAFQHRGSRSDEEYRRLYQIGEGQYGQVSVLLLRRRLM